MMLVKFQSLILLGIERFVVAEIEVTSESLILLGIELFVVAEIEVTSESLILLGIGRLILMGDKGILLLEAVTKMATSLS